MTNLNKCGLKLDGLLPAGRPQIIAPQAPVFAILRQTRIEPWRDAHHIWFPTEGRLPSQIRRGVFPHRTMRPCIPTEGPVDVVFRDSPWTAAGPVGHKKAVRGRFDGRPIRSRISSFKRGNQWFLIISILGCPSFRGEIFNGRGHHTCVPRDARGQVIERKEKGKVLDLVCCICGQIDLRGSVVVLWADV